MMLRCLLHRAAGGATAVTEATATRCLSFGTRARATPFSSSSAISTSTSSTSSASSSSSLSDTDLSSPEGDAPGQIRIDAYDASSFELSIAGKSPGSTRRRKVRGALVLSAPGGFVAAWKVAGSSSSNSSSLAAIAALVSPRPDIVLVGTGRASGSGSGGAKGTSSPSSTAAAAAAASISEAAGGAAVELHPTARAAALYNVLSQEGRSVMAAMLPAREDGSSLFSK